MVTVLAISTFIYFFEYPQLDKNGYYQIQDKFGSTSFYVYANDFFGTGDAIQQSDFFIAGSSRSQFAIDQKELLPFVKNSLNLSPYHLGFSYGEDMSFFLSLVKKYQIRDAMVLTFAGPWFFNNQISPLEHTDCNYVLYKLKTFALERFQNYLAYRIGLRNEAYPWDIRRHAATGFWSIRPLDRFQSEYPITEYPNSHDELTRSELLNAALFFHECAAKNLKPILVVAPANGVCPDQARLLAKTFAAPYLDISAEGLKTCDVGHLNQASAHIFTERLIDALRKTDMQQYVPPQEKDIMPAFFNALNDTPGVELADSLFDGPGQELPTPKSRKTIRLFQISHQKPLIPANDGAHDDDLIIGMPSTLSTGGRFPVLEIKLHSKQQTHMTVSLQATAETDRQEIASRQLPPGKNSAYIPLPLTAPSPCRLIIAITHGEAQFDSIRIKWLREDLRNTGVAPQ
jgi:hypothetical protein